MILGVTGTYASGKDTVANILIKARFNHISFSDILREELKKEEKEITRDDLINGGNKLREKYGPNILAKKALEEAKEGDYVFTSIRTPAEVELLKIEKDFILINVTSPDKIRLKRIIERNRENDPKTIEELKTKEARENTDDPNAQQLNKVAEIATKTIVNDSTLEELNKKVKELLADLL
ncbi:AAA family ATPase [Candidatus Woesearchaeota archaeon]|jgi:dephospho-CoA kinase|nr:AAA family ATPase [Candidatus Woesearchaeota archaeon]